jgi:hypothetical protein
MPKYTFACTSCKNKGQFFTSVKTEKIICNICNGWMNRQIPNITQSTIKETMDKFFNVARDPDMTKNLEDRNSEHFWKVMVPRLVREHPLEHSLENGWMYYDEQGRLQIQDKPPGKR